MVAGHCNQAHDVMTGQQWVRLVIAGDCLVSSYTVLAKATAITCGHPVGIFVKTPMCLACACSNCNLLRAASWRAAGLWEKLKIPYKQGYSLLNCLFNEPPQEHNSQLFTDRK